MEFLASIIIIAATSLASAVHGWGKVTKGIVLAVHALVVAGAGHLMGGYLIAGAGIMIAVAWWFTMRTGWQAGVELDYMSRRRGSSVIDIVLAYVAPCLGVGIVSAIGGNYLLGVLSLASCFIPAASVILFNYDTGSGKALGHNHGRFMDCRRATELIVGFCPGGVILSILLYTLSAMLG